MTKRAIEAIERTNSHEELIDIMQGFRRKFSKDMYQRIRKVLVQRKDKLFPVNEKDPKKRAEAIANIFFTLGSNRPQGFGVYVAYA